MSANSEYHQIFQALWHDFATGENFPAKRPLLAHYTSIDTLEKIASSNEIWLSNPLFMNDLDELRFGFFEGARAFHESEELEKCAGNGPRFKAIQTAFDGLLGAFNNKQALDVYVLCLTEHDGSDHDGLLSMWRGYGGDGNGAAIVIDTAKLGFVEESPFILSQVFYLTKEERRSAIESAISKVCELVRTLPDEKLESAVHALFEWIKLFAIFTKHSGFKEEREWRIAYLPDRDEGSKLQRMLDYTVGRNGIEPKLKFEIDPIKGVTDESFTLDLIVDRIILGPTVSSPLAVSSIQRMLQRLGRHRLAERLSVCTTPYRRR